MNILLLSGGSGKRLWPLSNEVRSKQFLKILKRPDGSHESMVQRIFRMIKDVDVDASITIATSQNQVALIKAQLGEDVGISVEPCRRDTFPAIALAMAYLHDIREISENDSIVVCPVDLYVEQSFFNLLKKIQEDRKRNANLTLIGVEPTYPSEKYGYIIPETTDQISNVASFKEKPDPQTAKQYIQQGALWNAGVFVFKIGYLLGIAKKVFGTSSYQELFDNYTSLVKISFDYAVAEKETRIQVVRFAGEWKDLGTWNTLTEEMSDEVSGNAIAKDCNNTHVINELQIPLIALGVSNLAIVASQEGILVAEKNATDNLKSLVSDQHQMYGAKKKG